MGQFRKQEDRRQGFLLPPSLKDWLPEGHLAWFVMEAVDQLQLDGLLDRYRMSGKGELAYPPRVMLSLLIVTTHGWLHPGSSFRQKFPCCAPW